MPKVLTIFTSSFDTMTPVFQELPGFLEETGYRDITDNAKTPFQKAFKTDLPAYTWLPSDPKRFSYMFQAMKAERKDDWLSLFPVEKEVGDRSAEPEKALFVDIGGGSGHQCIRLKNKYPNLPGRVILQDVPESIERVTPTEGIEAMAHNFYDPEPIKGIPLAPASREFL
jgi:demethylsterigmatocystin 6-O-methyltransferase